MRRVEVFKSDDGQLFEDKAECASADFATALYKLRGAFNVFCKYADTTKAPRENIRRTLAEVERRVHVLKQCLHDLDHYDEDPTDPERIAQALNEQKLRAVSLMYEIRRFFASPEVPDACEDVEI